jgi:hypothetical protein
MQPLDAQPFTLDSVIGSAAEILGAIAPSDAPASSKARTGKRYLTRGATPEERAAISAKRRRATRAAAETLPAAIAKIQAVHDGRAQAHVAPRKAKATPPTNEQILARRRVADLHTLAMDISARKGTSPSEAMQEAAQVPAQIKQTAAIKAAVKAHRRARTYPTNGDREVARRDKQIACGKLAQTAWVPHPSCRVAVGQPEIAESA